MASLRRPSAFAFAACLVFAACTSGSGSAAPSSAAASTAASTAPSAAASAAGSAAAGSAPPLAQICTAPPKHDGAEVTFVSYGGAYQKAQRTGWLEPYSKLTGVKFKEEEGTEYAKIKTQVQAGQVTWDIVDVGNDFGLDANADLLEPLDYSIIPTKDQILPGFAGTYRIGDITYGVTIAYNTTKVSGTPTGWADFFDLQKFPGKRGFWKYSTGGVFEFALMADGVAPKSLYPLDVDRAIKKLDTIKNDIVWWDTGAQSQERVGSGEVAMTMIWNGRGWSAKHTDNKPVEMIWKQQILTADYFVVPKGSPNKQIAMEFIAWATCANNNAAPSNAIPYGPTNKFSTANASVVKDLAVTNVDDSTAYFDDEYLVKNFDDLEAKFKAWVTK
jgi:putative spermidine/putrescine transport system substrate-binding protein